jgi:hypothetical protein
MKDPRFSVESLAPWITRLDLVDLSKAQLERFEGYFEKIADKCIGLGYGNHEETIQRHTERDIFSDILQIIKKSRPEQKLSLGIYGWLKLLFYNSSEEQPEHCRIITINTHHGFTGGRLKGAKSLNMQRWLWTHAADLVVFGHSHNEDAQSEAVEYVDRNDNICLTVRKGMYCGTFLKGVNDGANTYSEAKGYLPLPVGSIPMAVIKPAHWQQHERIKIML